MQRNLEYLLGSIILVSVVLGVFMLTRDHVWGDDFAAYIMQAQSIADGTMLEYVAANSFTMANASGLLGPVTYPWGFPLLLAPVFAVFGLKILALKLVSTFSFALFVVAFFLLARSRLPDREALVLTAVLAFNPALLQAQNEILADIPFLLFATLGLWLIDRFVNEEARDPIGVGPAIAIGCVVFLAVFMRANGILLLLALITAQCMRFVRRSRERRGLLLRDWTALTPYATLALLDLAQAQLFPSVARPLHQELGTLSTTSAWWNIRYYFWLPAEMFTGVVHGGDALYLVILAAFVLKLSRWRARDLPILVYALGTLALYVLWPSTQGLRFMFPFLPILVLFSYEGMRQVAGGMPHAQRERGRVLFVDLWAVLALLSLAACVQLAWNNMAANRSFHGRSYGAFSAGSSAMFEYIREETPADSVIVFFKPRAMRLRTDRDAFSTTNCEDLTRGDYVTIVKSNSGRDQIPPEDVMLCEPEVGLTNVYEKDDFVVYEIDAAP